MSSYVYVKNPNSKTYVYENTTYWDKESKSCKHYRKSIGHLDPDTGEASYYEKFFFIRETPVRGIKAEYNEEAIIEHKRNRIGWFVLAMNDIKDKVRALEVYRNKDSVDKCFDDLKNDLDMKRIRMHSAVAMEGRIFIQFISRLITTRLKQVMNEAG